MIKVEINAIITTLTKTNVIDGTPNILQLNMIAVHAKLVNVFLPLKLIMPVTVVIGMDRILMHAVGSLTLILILEQIAANVGLVAMITQKKLILKAIHAVGIMFQVEKNNVECMIEDPMVHTLMLRGTAVLVDSVDV